VCGSNQRGNTTSVWRLGSLLYVAQDDDEVVVKGGSNRRSRANLCRSKAIAAARRSEPAIDGRRQAWNIGPARDQHWTVLDGLPITADQMVVPIACPIGR
jgi:hypothetical protein